MHVHVSEFMFNRLSTVGGKNTVKPAYMVTSVCSYRIFLRGLKNEFDIAVVNEPSVFEPLKFYCMTLWNNLSFLKTFMPFI